VTLSSAQRKLARGIEQVVALRTDTRAFENSEAYTFRTEREPRSPEEVLYRCYADERQAPPDHWPLLAGEAIQNLRSALDHAVWSAWQAAGNAGTGDHTQFPITLSPAQFASQVGKVLQGVPEPIRAIVEATQPYNALPDGPQFDELQRLRTLSNIDKHRTLAAVVSAIRLEYVGVAEGVTIPEWHELATDKPLGHGETYISSFTARSEGEIEEMHVNPGFAYEVRIEQLPLNMLDSIVRRVYATLSHLETGQPLSPGAPYPL
jgi:hypothetical protein